MNASKLTQAALGTIALLFAGWAFSEESSQNIGISIDSRGGADGRPDGSSAMYVSLMYQMERPNTDVSAKVSIHPAGANPFKDTTSLHFNVEREFAIADSENWYHAVNFGYDKHGTSAQDYGDGCSPQPANNPTNPKCNYFGSVKSESAAWVAGWRKGNTEFDLGYDFFAEGVKATANTEVFGVDFAVDYTKVGNSSYMKADTSYTLGSARFYAQWRNGLNGLPSPEWSLCDVEGNNCTSNEGPDAPPGHSYQYGIAYVKHF